MHLDALVRMKLNSFRTIDRVHIQDMIEARMLDASWLPRLPAELAARLKELIDHPEGIFLMSPKHRGGTERISL